MAEFYKKIVKILMPDLISTLQAVIEGGTPLDPLNTSYIVLIPKKEASAKPDNFRPISLVHGVQKIFSKLLANRLQHRMHEIINTAQSGFLKNRQITESFIYAQQILSRAQREKVSIVLFKADIKKAFDTLSWDFMLQTMRKLGFPELWITWIKTSVLPGTS